MNRPKYRGSSRGEIVRRAVEYGKPDRSLQSCGLLDAYLKRVREYLQPWIPDALWANKKSPDALYMWNCQSLLSLGLCKPVLVLAAQNVGPTLPRLDATDLKGWSPKEGSRDHLRI